jgi:acetyltransferase
MPPSDLTPFFEPKGVAIIGASSKPNKLSFGILRNLVNSTYSGGVYPVNPNETEILGKPCYKDISQVPDPVDLAGMVVQPPPQMTCTLPRKTLLQGRHNLRRFSKRGSLRPGTREAVSRIDRYVVMRLIGPKTAWVP